METKFAPQNACMLKALVSHFHNDASLFTYLPPEQQEMLQNLTLAKTISFKELLDGKTWIKRIHFSWFLPYLSSLDPKLLPGYLSLFPDKIHTLIKEQLSSNLQVFEPGLFAQLILANCLKEALGMQHIIPQPLIAKGPFSPLLTISEKRFIQLIDYLGLHDLGAETRQIVDKKLLKRVMDVLSEGENKFLTFCSKQVIRWVPPKLNLGGWDGQKQSLHALLHVRGLNRLAKATIVLDPSYKWHLEHRLDTNRAKVLSETYKQPMEQMLVPYFQKQVIELLEHLN